MPYCPNCRDEFQDWVETCPDCKVPLVNELTPLPEMEIPDNSLVLVATAPNEIEAHLWKGILEDNDIFSMIKVAEGLNIYWSPMALKHELYVLDSDEKEAREILESLVDEFQDPEIF